MGGKEQSLTTSQKEIQTSFLPENNRQAFFDSLDTESLRTELDLVRQSGTTEEVSQKEREIAKFIQENTRFSIGNLAITGFLLKEVGIEYLVADIENANKLSSLLLIYSDRSLELFCLVQDPEKKGVITDDKIEPNEKNRPPITTNDILDFYQENENQNLTFSFKKINITVSKSKNRPKIDTLSELAKIIRQRGDVLGSIRIYRKLTKLDPENIDNYKTLSSLLISSDQIEPAIDLFHHLIEKDPKNPENYIKLAYALELAEKPKESIINAYEMVLETGRNDKTSELYVEHAVSRINALEERELDFRCYSDLARDLKARGHDKEYQGLVEI